MKELQNNFTTIEQSKRLLEIGVPADSADCYIYTYDGVKISEIGILRKLNFTERKEKHGIQKRLVPCWSVGRLQEIAKICAKEKEYYYASVDTVAHQENFVEWWVKHFTLTDNVLFDFSKLEE